MFKSTTFLKMYTDCKNAQNVTNEQWKMNGVHIDVGIDALKRAINNYLLN